MPQSFRTSAVGAVVVWALIGVALSAQQRMDDAPTVRYRGRVLDTGGGPLPGVDVTCTAKGGGVYRAKTDDKGEYGIAFTGGGCERIAFELAGFVPEWFAFPTVGVLDVSLVLGFAGERVWVAGAGRGYVVNADGSPAVDASVWLWRIGGAAPGGWRTDAAGSFSLPFTDGGDFVLCARGASEDQRTMCLPMITDPFPGGTVRLQLPPRRND